MIDSSCSVFFFTSSVNVGMVQWQRSDEEGSEVKKQIIKICYWFCGSIRSNEMKRNKH